MYKKTIKINYKKTKHNIKQKNNKTKKNIKVCNLPNNIKKLKYYNSNYLQNKICKFIPLFEFNPNIKKNIISSCFFKMRTGSYKNFSKYINGITILHDHINNNYPEFTLRLFIDLSIYNDLKIMNILKKLKKIEIVLYNCELFVKNKIYHLGTFGMIVRYFVMFDFPNNDAKLSIIMDIDVTKDNVSFLFTHYLMLKQYYTENEINKLYLFGNGRPYHIRDNNDMKYIYLNKYIKPYVISSKMIGIKHIPHSVIENYLHIMQSKKITFSTFFKQTDNIKNNPKCDEYLCFGMDEYFINHVLLDFIIKNNLSVMFLININLQQTLYYTYQNQNQNKNQNLINKFNSYILFLTKNIENKYFKNNNIKERINFINNIFYKDDGIISQSDITDTHRILIKNYYDLFYKLYKEKDFSIFNKDTLDIILSKNIIGYLKIQKYINYNNNLKNIKINDSNIKIEMSKEEIEHYHSVVDNNRKNFII
jgi:hypothetical protein